MASLEILVENLNRIARKNDLRTYKEMADYFNVKETALKRWENKSRCPSLKQIDKIADKMKCYSYALIQKMENYLLKLDVWKIDQERFLLKI